MTTTPALRAGRRRARWILAASIAAGLVALVAGTVWWRLLGRTEPEPPMDIETAFAHGSVGAEGTSLPLDVFLALPEICADELPGGYASIGFLFEPGHDVPIGISTDRLGVRRSSFTCAVCHAGSYRTSADGPRRIVYGMPGHQMDLQRFTRFALGCLTGPKFTADALLSSVARRTELSAVDRLLYRLVLVPALRIQGRSLQQEYAWFDARPDFGPGRFDGFAPYKDMARDPTIATADIMPVWNQAARGSRARHWDGNTTSTLDGGIASALGFGATVDSMRLDRLRQLDRWFAELPAPPYPFPVDAALADEGRPVFDARCAACHAPGGPRALTVIPLDEVGTDPARLAAFSDATARAMNALGDGLPWRFASFRNTDGYNAVLLDGLWARAPYLHNGSVPTLEALLRPEARPVTFVRGYDVYDPVDVGFIWQGPAAEREGRSFDTRLPGNGNGGHLFGADLAEAERKALIEFLKTF